MPQIPSLVDMLKSGVHFGHKKSRRHPKMEPFIYMTKGEVSIIDLMKTQESLATALDYMSRLASRGGSILFVGTKKQGQSLLKKYAESCGMPYVHLRWLGGTLTNFAVIGKLIKKFKKLKEQKEAGEFQKYTKKEQLDITREIEELDDLIGGISNLTKIPDAVFILDLKKEKTALHEAKRRNVPVVAVCDTNANPEDVDYPIPANDDAVKAIDMILGLVAAAIAEGVSRKDKDAAVPVPAVPVESEKQEAA
jgi:small subunit ribosomal protein S2